MNKIAVDIDLLQYYDTKIKKWIKDNVNNDENESAVIFLNKTSLPATGKENTLYVKEDGLYIWDMDTNKYISFSSSTQSNLKWGSF